MRNKILFALVVSSCTLFANVNTMQLLYTQQQYEAVIKEAKKDRSSYADVTVHLLWARSAFKLGRLQEAMAAYERVLILEPGNTEAQTALKEIYKQTQKEGLTVYSFDATQGTKIKTGAELSVGYDTNINVNPGGDILDEYFGTQGNENEISTGFIGMGGYIMATHSFDTSPKWFAKGIVTFFNQENFTDHLYDLTIGGIETGIGYLGNKASLYFPVTFKSFRYLDYTMMKQFGFTPTVTTPVTKTMITTFKGIYTKRNFEKQEDKRLDSTILGGEIDIYYKPYFTHITFKYEKRNADEDGTDTFVDAKLYTLSANSSYNFTEKLKAKAGYKYRFTKYRDDIGTPEVPSTTLREDCLQQIDLGLFYELNDKFTLFIRDAYTYNSSNYMLGEYRKNVLSSGIKISY